jgi:hypothetical protein
MGMGSSPSAAITFRFIASRAGTVGYDGRHSQAQCRFARNIHISPLTDLTMR